jgi:hypothetical protein
VLLNLALLTTLTITCTITYNNIFSIRVQFFILWISKCYKSSLASFFSTISVANIIWNEWCSVQGSTEHVHLVCKLQMSSCRKSLWCIEIMIGFIFWTRLLIVTSFIISCYTIFVLNIAFYMKFYNQCYYDPPF